MDTQGRVAIARALVASDRGLLAMDESTPTCDKRFRQARHRHPRADAARLPRHDRDDAEPRPLISGADLYDETIR